MDLCWVLAGYKLHWAHKKKNMKPVRNTALGPWSCHLQSGWFLCTLVFQHTHKLMYTHTAASTIQQSPDFIGAIIISVLLCRGSVIWCMQLQMRRQWTLAHIKREVGTKLHEGQALTWSRERRHLSQYRFLGSRRSRLRGSRPKASLSPFCQCFCGTIDWRRQSSQFCPPKSSSSSLSPLSSLLLGLKTQLTAQW